MSTSNINEQVKNLINEREKDCIDRYLNKMEKLGNVDYLKNENIVREKEAKNHIMYKMVIDEKTYLEIDGRKYEFLIEFDKKDYSYGIYYGCKCILDESKDILEQIMICEEEWKKLKDHVNMYLTLTFDIDFAERENVSNNANDNTYWPFWYRLGDDEDITVVAALAIKIISNVYRYVLKDGNTLEKPIHKKRGKKAYRPIKTKYTTELSNLSNEFDISKLINVLVDKKILKKHPILERCWQLNDLSNSAFSKLIRCYFKNKGYKTVPWESIIPIILSKNQVSLDGIRKVKDEDLYYKNEIEIVDKVLAELSDTNNEDE